MKQWLCRKTEEPRGKLDIKTFDTFNFLCVVAAAEEDAEIDMGDKELDDTRMHQLSHRELFLSRQYETINASQIRLGIVTFHF